MKPSAAEALKSAIRRALPVTIALVLLGAGVVSAIRQLDGPRYEASARIMHSTIDLGAVLTGTQPSWVDPERMLETASELVRSPVLYERAVDAAERDIGDPGMLRGAIDVAEGTDTDVMTLTATRSTPEDAVDTVNAVAEEYVEWRAELSGESVRRAIAQIEQQLAVPAGNANAISGEERNELRSQLNRLRVLDTLNSGGATLLERAEVAQQTAPRPIRDGLFGGALGLVIALLLSGVREAFNTRVRSEADVESALGRPVLASIQSLPKRTALVTVGRHESRWGDTYALLAANLMQIHGRANRHVIGVTSAIAGEGKTTTATNLAVAMAQRGQRVVLVDFDLRKPTVGAIFRIPSRSPGVVQVVEGAAPLERAVWSIPLNGGPAGQPVAATNGWGEPAIVPGDEKGSLRVIAAGGNERGARIARSERVSELIDDLAREADVVVLDTPPALATVEMAELSRHIDLVVTVVRYGKVTRRSLLALNRQAETWQTELVGAVITDAPPEEDDYYYYR